MNQHELNTQIEKFIAAKINGNESFSPEDIAYINQYEGSGGQGKQGAKGEGVLYEFFTPDYIVDLIWEIAWHYGYNGGAVLEPACGTGRFFRPAPDYKSCVGFEINRTSAAIAELTYPGVNIRWGHFEQAFMEPPRFTTRMKKGLTWLPQYPFSLVIGNPPYGKYRNLYSSFFKNPKLPQIEIFFMYYGLQLLKTGGLLIYLTSSNFLRNGITYNQSKDEIGKLAKLVDAYRLPAVFRFSEVPTDILVFKRIV